MGRVLGGGGGAPHSCPGRDSLRGGGPLAGSLGGPLGGSPGGPLGGSPCEHDHLAGPALLFCAGAGGTGQDM